jgi:hypothetical protein
MLAEMESNGLATPKEKYLKLFMVGVSHVVNAGSPTSHTWLMDIQIRIQWNYIM